MIFPFPVGESIVFLSSLCRSAPTTSNSLCNHFQIRLPKMTPAHANYLLKALSAFLLPLEKKIEKKVWSSATCLQPISSDESLEFPHGCCRPSLFIFLQTYL